MPDQSQGCGLDKERPLGFDNSLFLYQYIPFFQPHNDVFRQGVLWDQTAWLRSDWKIKLSLNDVKLVFRHERWLLDIILPHSMQSFWARILPCSGVALMRPIRAAKFYTVSSYQPKQRHNIMPTWLSIACCHNILALWLCDRTTTSTSLNLKRNSTPKQRHWVDKLIWYLLWY